MSSCQVTIGLDASHIHKRHDLAFRGFRFHPQLLATGTGNGGSKLDDHHKVCEPQKTEPGGNAIFPSAAKNRARSDGLAIDECGSQEA